MWDRIRSLHFELKDRNLHVILYSVIVILIGIVAYEKFLVHTVTPYQEIMLSKISQFDTERSLQEVPEHVESDSVKVPIFIYHSVRPHTPGQTKEQAFYDTDPNVFEKQLQYLKDNGYTVISLVFLIDALEQNITLPPKSVVLTFDDGWRNQFAYAFPLLKKYNDTATFFIVSTYVGGDYFLTWDQIRVLNNSGMTIGSHTLSHPFLVNIQDHDQLVSEVRDSKKIIENEIGQRVDLFAYPYGHYNDNVVQVVKDAGYTGARSTYKGIYNSLNDRYVLKGIFASDDMNTFVNALR